MSNEPRPRIAIVGAGAVGSLLGAALARGDQDVTLIGRSAHVDAIRRDGLTVNGVAGEYTVRIAAVETLDFPPDIVFVSVKTQDVETTCRRIKSYVGEVPVVMMQNGVISSGIAGSIFGRERIISCVLLFNAQFLVPGVVTQARRGPIVIGKVFSHDEGGEIDRFGNYSTPSLARRSATTFSGHSGRNS
jgi:2-dehydropantoate 2-reductase